ncbi:MAG: hypothetical protein OEZ23_03335, partial [Gammaproteobacteria bacterium]|nr:hypothetical protein [Gammaproteobacteria bacterium]
MHGLKNKLGLIFGFVLALAASEPLLALQYARPDTTVNAAGWTAVNAATHHQAINELTADDNTYIDSGNNNSSTVILGLSDVTDPGAYANNHILRYRCQSTGGKGADETCSVALYHGAALIFDTAGLGIANRGAYTL